MLTKSKKESVMPIEIRELVIRTEVVEGQQKEVEIDKKAIVEEVTEKCISQLKMLLAQEVER